MSTAEKGANIQGFELASLDNVTLQEKNRVVGFWIFLAGECALFASLIGTYMGLSGQLNNGPGPEEVFDLLLTGIATVVLLSSSLTGVLSIVGMQRGNLRMMFFWLGFTILLGVVFLGFQIAEFIAYYAESLTFQASAFASAFYALVGFHGGHVLFGVIWLSSLMVQTMRLGLWRDVASKLYIAGIYWHFVDVVWVVIFTVVYLMGKVG